MSACDKMADRPEVTGTYSSSSSSRAHVQIHVGFPVALRPTLYTRNESAERSLQSTRQPAVHLWALTTPAKFASKILSRADGGRTVLDNNGSRSATINHCHYRSHLAAPGRIIAHRRRHQEPADRQNWTTGSGLLMEGWTGTSG